jgi:DNA mismatch endonuclease (patch repair protein)
MDTRSKAKRSQIMAAVHSKNTGPELLVRRYLWAHGIRYRIHTANLPGKPDIVIPKHKLVIFVHGCFWHGHNCSRGKVPKSRVIYWKDKIKANKRRDCETEDKLRAINWKLVVIWECQIRTKTAANKNLPDVLEKIISLCSTK